MRSPMVCARVLASVALAVLAAGAGQWPGSTGAAEECKLCGRVTTSDGAPLAGVAVRFSNGLPAQVTDRMGCYEALAPAEGGQCVVTPGKAGCTFVPAARTVWLSGDCAEASFEAEGRRDKREDALGGAQAAQGTLIVTSFAVNNGARFTTSQDVTLDNTCVGSPTHYMASELPTFTGATWLPYSTAPAFTLSAGNDSKTVYFMAGNPTEVSDVVSDSIVLNEPTVVELVVNGPVKAGNAWPEAEEDWFYFDVAATGTHTIETWPGTLDDTYMELYADGQTTLLAQDDDSGEGACAKIVQALDPGTYFVKVRARDPNATGTYLIRVTTGDTTITVLNPYGDPAANTQLEVGTAEVVFSSANPGVLEVTCRFVVNPGAITGIEDKVRACIEPVDSVAPQWQTLAGAASDWAGTPNGRPPTAHATMGKATYDAATNRFEVKAVFTGLPADNAAFGPKKLWAQIVDGAAVAAEAEQPIEVFFPKLGTNNAGTGRNAGPNWFYYWKTGNVCGTDTGWEYESSAGYYGYYILGEDHINVCDVAPTVNSGPEYYWNDVGDMITVAGQGIGPHCCSETVAHENLHKWIYENWDALIQAAEADGQDNGDDYDDPDDDGIPNVHEPTHLGIVTDPNDPDTYNMGGGYSTYGDQEVRCRKIELDTGLTVTDADDWAFPGTNSYPRYPLEEPEPPEDGGVVPVAYGPGNDAIVQHGTGADDVQAVAGGDGNDVIVQFGWGGNDAQTAHGEGGNDVIVQYGGDGDDVQIATGGEGNDRIVQFGGAGDDTAEADGGPGNDFIAQHGREGNDYLGADGGEGTNTIIQGGGEGDDAQIATGGDGRDRIFQFGDTGNDTAAAVGGGGNDLISQHGGDGDDTLVADAGDGDDVIWQAGDAGQDTLSANGGEGDDYIVLLGGDDADTLSYEVSAGTDRVFLYGDEGDDSCTIYSNSQNFTVMDGEGQVLYQRGTGGSRIFAFSLETLTVMDDDGVTVVYTGSAP